ncbi:MAG: TRAP transporter large permease [Desulfobacterales bacterium]|nr:MAG: TRAP transporter large permease [Desulfobacterales bacterium]
MVILVLFLSFVVLLVFGVPITVSLGLSAVLATLVSSFHAGVFTEIGALVQQMFSSFDSFPIMAIPMFMLAGEIMNQGGASERLINLANVLVGRFRAGLAYIGIVASMFFACISGSGPADVAAIGTVMIPQMEKHGYHKGYSAVCIGAAGTLGILIPPSIPAVIYGVVTTTSIGKLFLAGLLPGILTGLALMATSRFIFKHRVGEVAGNSETPLAVADIEAGPNGPPGSYRRRLLRALYQAKYSLVMPIIILGGIYAGVFTPTEAATVAVVYGLVVTLYLDRELRYAQIGNVFRRAGLISGIVMILIGTALLFGRIMTLEHFDQMVADFILGFTTNRHVILGLVVAFLIFLGMFMETLAAIILFGPMLLKIVQPLGVDPIQFGIIMILASEVGFMTPPIGEHLFIVASISNTPLENIIRYALPYIFTLIIATLVVTYVPGITMFLPNLLYK